MRRSLLLLAIASLPLSGCGSPTKEGTTISFNAVDSDGNVTAGVNGKTGEVAINAPGFSGKLTLPKLQLGSDDFELNGVHLYPGSKITGMNILAREDKKGEADKSSLRVTFDSPASPETVRDWFADKLAKADFAIARDGMGLNGTDNEQKPFRLDLKPAANGHSTGTITAGG